MKTLLFRQMIWDIVEICDCIYKQEWTQVRKLWDILKEKLLLNLPVDLENDSVIEECSRCIHIGNYMRFYDCLTYRIKMFLIHQLLSLDEKERRKLSEVAKVANEEVLKSQHKELWLLISKENRHSNVECSYTGTENVSIMIREGKKKYKLFSSINPGLESFRMVSAKAEHGLIPDEIHVLGLGGGFLIREFIRRYGDTRVRVYIPDLDIFRAIICHIPIDDILKNQMIELYYDPLCIDFLTLLKKTQSMPAVNNIMFYIDRQELRAGLGNALMANNIILKHNEGQKEGECHNFEEGRNAEAGRNIYRQIKECLS